MQLLILSQQRRSLNYESKISSTNITVLTVNNLLCKLLSSSDMVSCCIVTGSDASDAILMFPALLTYINFVSVKLFVRVQNVFTVSKLLACIIIIVSGLYAICAGKCCVLFRLQEHKASCLATV